MKQLLADAITVENLRMGRPRMLDHAMRGKSLERTSMLHQPSCKTHVQTNTNIKCLPECRCESAAWRRWIILGDTCSAAGMVCIQIIPVDDLLDDGGVGGLVEASGQTIQGDAQAVHLLPQLLHLLRLLGFWL